MSVPFENGLARFERANLQSSDHLKGSHFMYTTNELMFPHHIIPSLKKVRGPRWQALVERVMILPEYHEETLAFMLMMVKLNGCVGCETDSYRAMKGCIACVYQTLRRYKGDDEELISTFHQALLDVRRFAETHPKVGIVKADEHKAPPPPAPV
jgi:hypothetical protein